VKHFEMERLKTCPLCGSGEKPLHFLSCSDHLMGTGIYNMLECPACQHVYTNPRPFEKDLPKYYKSEDYISHTEKASGIRDKAYFWVQSFMLSRKRKLINSLQLPGNKLVDVGCGTGAFLKKMKESGFEAVGVEPQAEAREKARSKGLQVVENQELMLEDQANQWHLITLWHVLEHQPDCIKSLQQFYKLLAPGAWLIIAVPQYKSFDAAFYKQFWAAYDLPRHLHHFSSSTMVLAAQNIGFRKRKVKGMPFDAFYVAMLSEKYKKSFLGFFRAILIGFWSNILATLKIRPWSSQIFFFQKPE
jgi:2-polyprenyl-3-methyl-5-hydroxy-6-metoxy-1,4-benzoquinol methylase